jgi:uncharacterized protein YciI
MIIIELSYKKPIAVVEQYLHGHRDFLTRCYERKIFIASGPKIPRDGGIILSKASMGEAKQVIKEDPFYIHEVADYRIIEFDPINAIPEFKRIIE